MTKTETDRLQVKIETEIEISVRLSIFWDRFESLIKGEK